MDYLESKSAPTVLRNHYEKLLFPYDVFQSGLMTGGDPNHEVKYNYVNKRKLGCFRTKISNLQKKGKSVKYCSCICCSQSPESQVTGQQVKVPQGTRGSQYDESEKNRLFKYF